MENPPPLYVSPSLSLLKADITYMQLRVTPTLPPFLLRKKNNNSVLLTSFLKRFGCEAYIAYTLKEN